MTDPTALRTATCIGGLHELCVGVPDLATALDDFAAYGCRAGEHGALLFGPDGEIFFAPALPLADVVDPTGAGDTFAGGFVGYLDSVGDYSFDSMKRGLMYAATMASFCVEAFGPERMMDLTEEAIRARRADFSQLIQVG